jgi:hypothetical protein
MFQAFRSMSSLLRMVGFAAVLLTGLGLMAAAASAKPAKPVDLPFKGKVTAQWDNVFNALPDEESEDSSNTAYFTGISQVSHMGRAIQQGSLSLDWPDDEGIYPGAGEVTITAANGDELTFWFEGSLNAATGEGWGDFWFTGGTGRYANATGGGQFQAMIDLSQPENQSMTVILDGRIRY